MAAPEISNFDVVVASELQSTNWKSHHSFSGLLETQPRKKQSFSPERYKRRRKEAVTMDITSETSTILDLPPSAVAFCPSHPQFYVVGTYFLHPKEEKNDDKSEELSQEAPQKRTGTLILYRLEGSAL